MTEIRLADSEKKMPASRAYENLANAVIERAVLDWRQAYWIIKDPKVKKSIKSEALAVYMEVEKFFLSGEADAYLTTKMPGEALYKKIRRLENEKYEKIVKLGGKISYKEGYKKV